MHKQETILKFIPLHRGIFLSQRKKPSVEVEKTFFHLFLHLPPIASAHRPASQQELLFILYFLCETESISRPKYPRAGSKRPCPFQTKLPHAKLYAIQIHVHLII